MKIDNKKIISLDEVLIKFQKHKEKFINELDKEEDYENSIETEQSIKNDIKGLKLNTELKKKSFINEIKSNLGEELRKAPGNIKKIEKSKWDKIKFYIKSMFKKF